jgi:hypothetical protein
MRKARLNDRFERGAAVCLGAKSATPNGQVDRVGGLLADAQMLAVDDGDKIIGSAAQLGADVLDDQIEIALRADNARQDLARDRFLSRRRSRPRPGPSTRASAARARARRDRRIWARSAERWCV